jgi:hypothetical protein
MTFTYNPEFDSTTQLSIELRRDCLIARPLR